MTSSPAELCLKALAQKELENAPTLPEKSLLFIDATAKSLHGSPTAAIYPKVIIAKNYKCSTLQHFKLALRHMPCSRYYGHGTCMLSSLDEPILLSMLMATKFKVGDQDFILRSVTSRHHQALQCRDWCRTVHLNQVRICPVGTWWWRTTLLVASLIFIVLSQLRYLKCFV